MIEYLVDTNLFVYAHDRSEPVKQRRARELLERLFELETGAITTQILGEFFRTVTCRLSRPLGLAVAQLQVESVRSLFPVLPTTEQIVVEAVRGVVVHGLSYWDAQIWAAARLNQIPTILSEDFQSGRAVETVRFEHPLAESFRLPLDVNSNP